MALHWWMSVGGCNVVGCHMGRASLAGCHWLNGRVVLAKEYIYYIVNKTWHSPCGAHLYRSRGT